ncbi:MAG: FAD:protein FMN transferase, partial [Verrucomicrobiae bacterium]|nr:FAD:protein FMN transferase [Verrucomicrobiae bacterium]
MRSITAARCLMNTKFEVLVYCEDEPAALAAAEAALDEIAKVERQISRFRPDSEISHVNREAATRPVRVSPTVFDLLERIQRLVPETDGLFDPTITPLLELWQKKALAGQTPSPTELDLVTHKVGIHKVELSRATRTVRFTVPGMALDLSGIGKGYALDVAANLLAENGVGAAFIHGG